MRPSEIQQNNRFDTAVVSLAFKYREIDSIVKRESIFRSFSFLLLISFKSMHVTLSLTQRQFDVFDNSR